MEIERWSSDRRRRRLWLLLLEQKQHMTDSQSETDKPTEKRIKRQTLQKKKTNFAVDTTPQHTGVSELNWPRLMVGGADR